MCLLESLTCFGPFFDTIVEYSQIRDRDVVGRWLNDLIAFFLGIFTFDSSNMSTDQARYISNANSIICTIGAFAIFCWAVYSMTCLFRDDSLLELSNYLGKGRADWSPLKRKRAMSFLLSFLNSILCLIDGILVLVLSFSKGNTTAIRTARAGIALNIIWMEGVFFLILLAYPRDQSQGCARITWNIMRGLMEIPTYIYGILLFVNWTKPEERAQGSTNLRNAILIMMASTVFGKAGKLVFHVSKLCCKKNMERIEQKLIRYQMFICVFEMIYFAFILLAFYQNWGVFYFVIGWIAKQIPVSLLMMAPLCKGTLSIKYLDN